jgi:hypothetical protein
MAVRKILLLSFLSLLLFGCTKRVVVDDPAVEPAPAQPNVAMFNSGKAEQRPIVHEFDVTKFTSEDGWLLSPSRGFELLLSAERAAKIEFRGFTPGTDQLDPDKNGLFDSGELAKSVNGKDYWRASRESPGGKTIGIYAVATNEHGRALSTVIYVTWQYSATDKEAIAPSISGFQ